MLDTGVYCIRNLVNKKVYVGSSAKSLRRRRNTHFSKLDQNVHANKHLQASWNEYGKNSFEFIILEYCFPESCIKNEQFWIDKLESTNNELGYNLRIVAESNLGFKYSEESRLKRLGTKLSEKHKQNISNAMKGREFSPEHCANITKAKTGKKASEETRKKLSEAHKGKMPTNIEQLRIMNTGKKLTPEHCEKIRLSWIKRKADMQLRKEKIRSESLTTV